MSESTLKRSFILGDEWVYFKFYTGAKTSDKILIEAIKPMTDKLINTNKIDQWFFIRYADPDLHLRVRLHVTKKSHIGIIIQTVFKHIEKFVAQDLIWKVQTDTYQREIERYGVRTTELSERLFFIDSRLLLNILPQLKSSEGEVKRWLFALKMIDALLDSFQYNANEKLNLLTELKENFGKEFGMNHFLKGQLDAKFRKERSLIETTLNSSTEKNSNIADFLLNIQEYKDSITLITGEVLSLKMKNQLDISLDSLLASYIHMIMNRIFKSKQRVHELVLYDFLYRYYKSSLARQIQKSDAINELIIN